MYYRNIIWFVLILLSVPAISTVSAQSYNTIFDKGDDGWIGASTGFSPHEQGNYDISTHWQLFDNGITNGEKGGILFHGKNLNAKLFLYAFKRFSDLKPNSTYSITFNSTVYGFPTANSENGVIYVKAGSLLKMPASLYMFQVECNFNKGEIGRNGRDLKVLDSLTVGKTPIKAIVHNYLKPLEAKTNAKGEIYLIFGFEPTPDITILPDLFLSFLRVSFNYEGPAAERNQISSISMYSLPNFQGFYFDTDLEADISNVSLYSASGHLIKVVELNNPFYDHIIHTSDLSPGFYQVVFTLNTGRRYTREIHILP